MPEDGYVLMWEPANSEHARSVMLQAHFLGRDIIKGVVTQIDRSMVRIRAEGGYEFTQVNVRACDLARLNLGDEVFHVWTGWAPNMSMGWYKASRP